jgi:hypothetical protein
MIIKGFDNQVQKLNNQINQYRRQKERALGAHCRVSTRHAYAPAEQQVQTLSKNEGYHSSNKCEEGFVYDSGFTGVCGSLFRRRQRGLGGRRREGVGVMRD